MSKTPRISTEFYPIYIPLPDVFAGPDGPTLRAGQRYDDWIPNDHTFVQAPDGRWHVFGITGPNSPIIHEAEWQSFHIVAPAGSLADAMVSGLWEEWPKLLTPAERPGEPHEFWAPFAIEREGVCHMFYGPTEMRSVTSTDLMKWTPQGAMFTQEGAARDPWITRIGDLYHMVYVAGESIWLRTSRDLADWSETLVEIFPMRRPGAPESPMLIELEGDFYLFWTIHDGTHGNWDHRTFVFRSDQPDDFRKAEEIAMLDAHAPELVRDADGEWFISSVEWPIRGVSLARLAWE